MPKVEKQSHPLQPGFTAGKAIFGAQPVLHDFQMKLLSRLSSEIMARKAISRSALKRHVDASAVLYVDALVKHLMSNGVTVTND